MGSTSDLEVMTPAIETLEQFGIEVDKRVISAHRAPHELMKWAESARERGLSIIIAGAGGAVQPGLLCAKKATRPGHVLDFHRRLDRPERRLSV